MSIREKSNIAVLGALSCALLVTGCTSARFAGPSLVTNSVNTASNANLSQQMPGAVAATKLPSAGRYLSASNSRSPYIPAAAVGESNVSSRIQSRNPNVPGMNTRVQAASNIGQSVAAQPSVMRQQLPILTQQPVTSTQSMPSMPSLAEVDLTKAPKIDNSFTTASILESAGIATSPRAVSDNVFIHRIESGESLYSVARRYEVTTDAIVAANGLASPDRIIVGQDVIIPGRPGMTALKTVVAKSSPAKSVVPVDLAKVAEAKLPPAAITAKSEPTQSSQTTSSLLVPTRNVVSRPVTEQLVAKVETPAQTAPTPIARPSNLKVAVAKPKTTTTELKPVTPTATKSEAPITTASVAKTPKSVAGSFRWPVKGRVITDFRGSKNTGVNIEVPEGAAIRAAENGQVIYVGSAVEGFGNLILIKHSNGYVSAYAHLKDITVAKGTYVDRGDSIGTAGMTGAVSRPQLHFELRQGATPVDPMPLLAS